MRWKGVEDERRVGLIGRRRSTRHIIFYGLSLLLLPRSLVRPPAPAPPPLPPTDLRYLAQMLTEFTVIEAQVWYVLWKLSLFSSVVRASNVAGAHRALLSKLERHFVLNRKRVSGAMHQIFDCFVYRALPASPLVIASRRRPWAGGGSERCCRKWEFGTLLSR